MVIWWKKTNCVLLHSRREIKDVRAQNVPTHRFFFMPKRQKQWGITDFVLERTCLEEYPKSENRASLANKATVSVFPKMLQLDL